jgi:hypothetical protein
MPDPSNTPEALSGFINHKADSLSRIASAMERIATQLEQGPMEGPLTFYDQLASVADELGNINRALPGEFS